MKYIITENQHNKTKEIIKKSFDEYGMLETLKRFKLPLKGLDRIFKGEKLEFDCDQLDDLFYFFMTNGDLPKEITIGERKNGEPVFKLSFDISRTGAFMISFVDTYNNDGVSLLATPFYEGACDLPVEYSNYFKFDSKGNIIENDYVDFNEYYTDVDFTYFTSFSKILDWFENDYIDIITKLTKKVLSEGRRGEYKDL